MLKKYKNQLFDLIKQSGLDINRFQINEEDEIVTTISFNDSPFGFITFNSKESFDLFQFKFTLFSPKYAMSDFYPPNNWTNFSNLLSTFSNWIENHIKDYLQEQSEPDLWDEYLNGNKTLNFETIDFGNKESFTSDELVQIKMAINELKYLIQSNLEANETEQLLINDRLDYLINASLRLNKFD
jgi:hypothetical protein